MKIKLQNSKPIPVTSTPDCFKCDVKITGEMYFCNSNYGTNHPICESCESERQMIKNDFRDLVRQINTPIHCQYFPN